MLKLIGPNLMAKAIPVHYFPASRLKHGAKYFATDFILNQ